MKKILDLLLSFILVIGLFAAIMGVCFMVAGFFSGPGDATVNWWFFIVGMIGGGLVLAGVSLWLEDRYFQREWFRPAEIKSSIITVPIVLAIIIAQDQFREWHHWWAGIIAVIFIPCWLLIGPRFFNAIYQSKTGRLAADSSLGDFLRRKRRDPNSEE